MWRAELINTRYQRPIKHLAAFVSRIADKKRRAALPQTHTEVAALGRDIPSYAPSQSLAHSEHVRVSSVVVPFDSALFIDPRKS
jgi:hypothetical protein